MNAIFTVVMILSAIILCINSPADFLPSMLDGGMNAAKCCLTLLCVYVVWMGLSAVAEDCRITQGAARLLSPFCKRLFKTENGKAIEAVSMNLSCNLLGIGGAATPYGVKAIEEFERDKNTFAQNLLFIINATSIQLIPTTVIALRAAAGSLTAHDITLPSLLATIVSTGLGVTAFLLASKLSARKKRTK